jgi:hypothetical protein
VIGFVKLLVTYLDHFLKVPYVVSEFVFDIDGKVV